METWKQIKGLEHTKYLISDKGNVKNKDTNYITDKYLLCYYENKKLYDENITLITKLLEKKFKKNIKDKDKTSFIFELTSGIYSHHKPISGIYLSKYLNVNICLPQNIIDIYTIYDNIEKL
jgi:hypothetical protein